MNPDHNVDVLVIGGGIIGLAIGYYLRERHLCGVEIIEKESVLASHASAHNAGGISSAHLSQTNEMSSLAKESSRMYRELAKKDGFCFDFKINGTIILLKDQRYTSLKEEGIAEFRERTRTKVELLSGSKVREIEPNVSVDKDDTALFYSEDAQGNSKKLAECFARSSAQKGIRLSSQTEVLGFETKDDVIQAVKTNNGIIRSKTVILAAGPWSGRIASMLGIKVPIEPIKGHLITSRRPNSKVLNSFILGENYYVLQTSEGDLVVGGGEDASGFDTSVIESRAAEAWEEGVSYVPILRMLGQESASACLRPYASGGLPVIGESTRFRNLIFATGHFRSGFSLAPVTGKIVADLVVDQKTTMDVRPFSPRRFGA